MKRQRVLPVIICALMCSAGFGVLREQGGREVGLTIYNDNFAVVRESRQLSFDLGVNRTKFTDVASAIDPTSVHFRCISAPGAVSVLEQNYEYDLVNAESLLKRYIDKNITVVVSGAGGDRRSHFPGRLLAAMGGELILKSKDNEIQIISRDSVEEITLQELPEDLVTRPTLVWLVEAKRKGRQLCRVTYTTGQIGWHADYSALLSADEKSLDFSGWVTIDNKSGATYKDATIKLIAGDVRRIVKQQPRFREMLARADAMTAGAAFEEKAFMEYHLYTLGRKSTINNNQVKQIEFITPALGVAVKKIYTYQKKDRYFYQRKQQPDKVQTKFEFENTEANGLGIALPKGKIRVFKKDPADGMLEFVGEDEIDHTPRKEKLSLYIGDAFDIVPEYTLIDSQYRGNFSRETHKIELRNRKDEAVMIFVEEKFVPGRNWTIRDASLRYEKRDARTIRFEVKVGADSTATVQYTVTQTW